MKIKGFIIWVLLLTVSIWAQAQGTFVIEGQVKNVEDGTIFTLFRQDGDVGSCIAVDTIRNGHFRFQVEAVNEETDKLSLMGRDDSFPSMSLSLWARPGSHLRISGENSLIYTWNVESDVPEQQVHQTYIKDSYDLWNEYQSCHVTQKNYIIAARSAVSEESKNILKAKYDSLKQVSDEISLRIDANEIRRMKQTPVDVIWLDCLRKLAMGVKYQKDYPYKEDVIALYNQLTEKDKQTFEAQNAYTCLFPPKVVEEGDEMVDADLYDLDGNIHHLADFKGKYILLDFWSRGCGPCIMALPEMKEIAEMYKDRLTIVSLSTDTKKGWEVASKTHEMTWQNLNEMKGSNGLYANYGVRGIPNYVLISPQGKIIRKWSGYGTGSLKLKLRRILDTETKEMSLRMENGNKVVDCPKVRKTNTDIPEIRQVVLTDSATIVRIHACYIPKYWIQVAKNIQLVADDGTVCSIIRAEGIPLGEKFFMPESGESDYTLYFTPLPTNARSFDMIEQGVSTPDCIEGIALTLN